MFADELRKNGKFALLELEPNEKFSDNGDGEEYIITYPHLIANYCYPMNRSSSEIRSTCRAVENRRTKY